MTAAAAAVNIVFLILVVLFLSSFFAIEITVEINRRSSPCRMDRDFRIIESSTRTPTPRPPSLPQAFCEWLGLSGSTSNIGRAKEKDDIHAGKKS
jgi:hypothetical protein